MADRQAWDAVDVGQAFDGDDLQVGGGGGGIIIIVIIIIIIDTTASLSSFYLEASVQAHWEQALRVGAADAIKHGSERREDLKRSHIGVGIGRAATVRVLAPGVIHYTHARIYIYICQQRDGIQPLFSSLFS